MSRRLRRRVLRVSGRAKPLQRHAHRREPRARTRSSALDVARREADQRDRDPASPTAPARRTRRARGCRAAASASARLVVHVRPSRAGAPAPNIRWRSGPRSSSRLPTRIRSEQRRPAIARASRRAHVEPPPRRAGCGCTGTPLRFSAQRVHVDQREHSQRRERVARRRPREGRAASARAGAGTASRRTRARRARWLSIWTSSRLRRRAHAPVVAVLHRP